MHLHQSDALNPSQLNDSLFVTPSNIPLKITKGLDNVSLYLRAVKWYFEIVANEELLFTTADHVSFSLKGFPPKNPGRNHVETSS